MSADITRTHLKNVFWPKLFVGATFPPRCGVSRLILYGLWVEILDIQQYASGFRPTRHTRSDGESSNAGKLGSAAPVPATCPAKLDRAKTEAFRRRRNLEPKSYF